MNCVSITQEIITKAVSDFVHLSKLFSKKNETRAGVSYLPSKPPACKLVMQRSNDVESLAPVGFNSPPSPFYNNAINTEKADEGQNVSIKAVTIHERCVHQQNNDTNSRTEREVANQPHCFRYVWLHQTVLEVQWMNTLFALPAMEGREVTGSIPVKYIPNGLNLQLSRSDPGAGTIFKPLTPTPTPAPNIIIRGD